MYQLADNCSSTPRHELSGNMQFGSDNEQPMVGNGYLKSSAAKFDYLDENRDGLSSRSFINYIGTKNSIALGGPESDSPPNREASNLLQNNSGTNQNTVKGAPLDVDPLGSFVNLKMSEKLHSSDIQSEDFKFDEAKSMISRDSQTRFLSMKREELRRNRSMDYGRSRNELKEPASAETKSCKDDNGTSFFSDIVISKKRGDDELKKSGFVKRNLLPSKPVTISLTFDAFVDQVKGHESTSIASNYPSYKIDKRLIFLGKEVDFPWHIISYHSTFRKLWNLFIIAIIIYQIFWYPVATTFIYEQAWPIGTLIFEIVSIFIFALDILLNIRTTFSNENNEEIIDGKMMSRNYVKTRLFLVDIITTLPVPEVLLLVLISYEHRWVVYSLVTMVRMLRFFKISAYLQHRTLSAFSKLLRIFITFFIFVHWASCVWYVVIKAEFPDPPTMENLWFPNNLRMISTGDDDLLAFYYGMPTIKVYGFTLLSVFMLVVGSDMAPTTDLQIWFSVLVGLFGAVSLAYIFGLVTLTINRANEESQLYQQQLEELKQKLRVNKIPHNLRVKVMEYFYYSWRKNSVLKKMDDFSELSIPLQRDIALYQHQEMIMKVPLFRELDPVEILSIVQKLKTSIYMPGDKIIREGERGTEMFFIQEGVVEKIYRKNVLKNRDDGNSKHTYDRVMLERGNYFGEVALMSNSKRIFDVNAYEFCILYSFSRSDYESLKSEFRDIGPRLRSGLKHYKNTHMGQLTSILRNLDIFQNFTEAELRRIGDEYLEEMFVDPDKVILAPKLRTNAIYVIFAGNVRCYRNDDEAKNYVNYLKRSDNKDNWTIVDVDEEEDIDCLDDDILNLEKDKLSMDDQKKRLDLVRSYSYGEYFGTLDFDINEIKCSNYFLTDSGCQIGAITQALKSQMAIEDPELYEKLRNNIIRCCPRRVMMPIEEESDSSFTTKNNTVIKTRVSRRTSILSDMGKRPALIKTTSLNKQEDDIAGMKGELQQLEEQMNYFKNLIINVNAKLASALPSGYPSLKSQEASPLKTKGRSKINQGGSLAKITNRDLANTLLGVDEEDQIEESQSIKKDDEF